MNVTASVFLCQRGIIAPCAMVNLEPELFAVCVLTFLFGPYTYLTVFILLVIRLFVVFVWVDGSGFDLLSLLIYHSTRVALINAQLLCTVSLLCLCVLCRVRF